MVSGVIENEMKNVYMRRLVIAKRINRIERTQFQKLKTLLLFI